MKTMHNRAFILCGAVVGVALLCGSACAQDLGQKTDGTEPEQAETATKGGRNPMVIIETSKGTIKAELWPDKAKQTVANFLGYADDKFYDGLIFHRVIKNFMIQGGGFTPDMQQKPAKAAIRNEARSDVRNLRGTLAMARTMDVDSATSQFFINLVDNGFLDHKDKSPRGFGYCVFGKVVEGMDVVDAIAAVETGSHGPFQDVPRETVEIISIRRADTASPSP